MPGRTHGPPSGRPPPARLRRFDGNAVGRGTPMPITKARARPAPAMKTSHPPRPGESRSACHDVSAMDCVAARNQAIFCATSAQGCTVGGLASREGTVAKMSAAASPVMWAARLSILGATARGSGSSPAIEPASCRDAVVRMPCSPHTGGDPARCVGATAAVSAENHRSVSHDIAVLGSRLRIRQQPARQIRFRKS